MPALLSKLGSFAIACALAPLAANAVAARGTGVDRQREACRHLVRFEDNE